MEPDATISTSSRHTDESSKAEFSKKCYQLYIPWT
jgi:hypothetical protein